MNKGMLIVIDGIDGSGKTTQIELLRQYLASQGPTLQVEVINFPRYGENLYADLVTRYLEGEFGEIKNVNPYLMSLAYAGDRLLAKLQIEKWLHGGKLVIANRYVSSNKAHLGANLSKDEREEFMNWLDELEYKTNGLPKPHLSILLNVNPQIGQENALTKEKLDVKDIHEESSIHLEKAAKIYLELSKKEASWIVVNCMKNDKMRPIRDIHKDILKIFNERVVGN